MRVMVVWCPDWSVVAALEEAGAVAALPRRRPLAPTSSRCATAPPAPRAYAAGSVGATPRPGAPSWCCCPPTPTATPAPSSRSWPLVEDLRPGVAALRPGLLAVRAPGSWYGTETAAAATACQALVEGGVWDVRVGIADDLFTAEQAARTADVQSWAVVPAGGSATFLRGLPVHVLQDDGPRGRELVGLLQRLGLRTLGDLADLPGEAVEHRLGTYGAAVRRRARGEDRALFAARTPPPELDAEVSFEPPLDSVEAITFSVRTTAERFVAQLAHHQLVATGVRVEAESDGVVCSSRAWLHPRHFGARDLVDRVHWQLQSATVGGSLRARKQSGAVRAPIERVRFVPEVVEPAAAHGEALWGARVRRPRRAGRGPGAGHGRLRRRTAAGAAGRSQPRREAGAGAVGRARGRPAPGRPAVAGPGAGAGAGPGVRDSPGRRGRGRRGPRGVRHRPRRRHRRAPPLPGRGGSGGQGLPWQPVTAWAGPWPTDEGWWSGGAGPTRPLPGRRRRRACLAAAARPGRLVPGGRL